MAEEKLLSLREAAERLDLHPRTLRRWIYQGRVEAVKVPGRFGGEWRVPESALEALLESVPKWEGQGEHFGEAPRCQGTKADGMPCQAPAYRGSAFCRWHQDQEGEP